MKRVPLTKQSQYIYSLRIRPQTNVQETFTSPGSTKYFDGKLDGVAPLVVYPPLDKSTTAIATPPLCYVEHMVDLIVGLLYNIKHCSDV